MHDQTSDSITSSPSIQVLVVDDEKGILRALKATLRKEYCVHTVQDGEQALQIMRKQQIHIILSDERLEKEKGSDLLAKIKEEFPSTIRILFSGYTDIQAIQNAINKASVFKFLIKPWNSIELKKTLQEAWKQYTSLAPSSNPLFPHLKTFPILLQDLESEVQRCVRYGRHFTCVFFNIHRLQVINNLYGFFVGDTVIKKIAKNLLREIRGSDVLGQIEQGKFIAILSETNQEGAQVFIDRCLHSTQKISIGTEKGDLSISLYTSTLTITQETLKQPQEIISSLQS